MADRARRRSLALALVAALVLGACAGDDDADLDPALARLALVEDVVDVRAGEVVSYAPGRPGQDLGVGDDVRTGQPGFAEIAYRDGSLTRLDAGTAFEVVDLSEAGGVPAVDATLDGGRVWSRVRDLDATGRFEIEAATGTAAVRGTAFDVDCRNPEAGGCIFTLVEGELDIANPAGDSVQLVDLQRVTVAPDGTLGEVAQLTLAQVQQDPWLARNLAADARRGFPVLAEQPAEDPEGAPVVVTEPPGFDDGQVRVRSTDVRRGGGDTVTQTVVVGGPRTVQLRWRFCNPQVCGTSENSQCTHGYRPSYAGELVQQITIPAPEGHELVAATFGVGAGPTDTVTVGRLGEDDDFLGTPAAFTEAPARTEAGGITFSLAQSGLEDTLRRVPGFPGHACAVSLERRDEILAQYGPEVVLDAATVAVTLTWRVTQPLTEPVRQDILAGTSTIGTAVFEPLPANPPMLVTDAPVFTTADERWGDDAVAGAARDDDGDAATFAEIGTVPTALANVLVRVGLDTTPPRVADALREVGAWRPGTGTDLRVLRNSEGALDLRPLLADDPEAGGPVLATPGAVADTLAALRDGEVVALAAVADRERRSVVVLVGYDQGTDRVHVLDPHAGEVTVPLDDLLERLAALYVLRPHAEAGVST